MMEFDALERYAKDRDAEAFRMMVEMYQGLVYGAARRVLGDSGEVEDVVQMTFLKLAEAAGKIRENLGGWLYATAVNGARDVLRREGTRKRHEMAGGVRAENSLATWAEVSGVVDEEILGLPAELRDMVVGHFLRGESQRVLAEQMGVSQPTIGRRIAEAVEILRGKLSKRGYGGDAGALTVGLVGLAKVAVPMKLTGELMKMGLAGTSGKVAGAAGGVMVKKLVMAGLVVAVLGVGGVLGWKYFSGGGVVGVTGVPVVEASAPAVVAEPKPVVWTKETALAQLSKEYALAEGEDIRKIPAPFSAAREAFVASEYPNSGPPGNVQSLGFLWDGKGSVMNSYMSYDMSRLDRVFELAVRGKWYHFENLDRVKWKPGKSDWVVRGGLTEDENIEGRLAGLAKIMSGDMGVPVKFVHKTEKMPCVVWNGETKVAEKNENGNPMVFVTMGEPTAEDMANWRRKLPKGWITAFTFEQLGKLVDAPCFTEGDYSNNRFVVAKEARLHRGDTDYRENLRTLMERVRGQMGGTFTIEDREEDVWEPAVGN